MAGDPTATSNQNPVTISTLPTPKEEDFLANASKFGPHYLHACISLTPMGPFTNAGLYILQYEGQNGGIHPASIVRPGSSSSYRSSS
jgi:hypothetical protein